MMAGRQGTLFRTLAVVVLAVVMVTSLAQLDQARQETSRDERLYFPSGKFLVESALGFREAVADYMWFRFIQYFGAYARGENDLRYFDLLLTGITRLDPRFVEAYHFGSLVAWSEQGDFPKSIDILKRGVLHNPDVAKLPFQIAFTYYVFYHEYELAAFWFETAAKCSDATSRETRFAAFSRYKAGNDEVSLALWKDLLKSASSADMQELAVKMINKLEGKINLRQIYGDDFIGPIPEIK